MRKGADKPIEVAITRDIIRVRSVRHRIEGTDVGYIRITQFNEQTTEGLKKALSDISAQIPPGQAARLRHRSAQQSGRPARSGDLGIRYLPRPRLSWEETGGPAVVPPIRTGFGRRIIEDTMRRIGKH